MAVISGMHDNELVLTAPKLEEISEAVELFNSQGRRSATILSDGATTLAELLAAEFTRHHLPAPVIAGADAVSKTADRDGLFLAVNDPAKLSRLLTSLAKATGMFVWAPKTRHFFKSRPVFVQSVPKSGTHVVFECLKAFGYAEPPSLDLPQFDAPLEDGVFYNLQHMPISCLSAPHQQIGRFVDSLSRSVIVFIIRDPRDIAVSLAYYLASQEDYHITASLFHAMPADERISRVITGDYPIPIYLNRYLNLSGNIRELFSPYLSLCGATFPNVWHVRFEDIIGASGGGNIKRQLETVWGLQLALHVPGRPSCYAGSIYSTNSLTYRKGQIGDHLIEFSQDHHKLFKQSAGELLRPLGYADRWSATRAFSVILPSTCESSAIVATELRSEFSSRGRNFLSILIRASDGNGFPGFTACVEVEAAPVGEALIEDRVRLLIDARDDVRDMTTELSSIDQARYSLRVSKTSPTQFLINAIIDALVKIGCVDRLLQGGLSSDPSLRFEGEIRDLADKRFDALAAGTSRPEMSSYAVADETFKVEGTAIELVERLEALEDSLAERTQRLLSLEAAMEERVGRLLALEQTLHERSQQIVALEATMEERSRRLLTVEKALEERSRDQRIAWRKK